jgi:hypothetical protein
LTENMESEEDFLKTSKTNMLQELFHYRKNKDLPMGTENEILLFITIQNQKSLYLFLILIKVNSLLFCYRYYHLILKAIILFLFVFKVRIKMYITKDFSLT